jgi:hypothetical protein
MKFETIKRVILAAIMLPFVFMLIEGVVVISSPMCLPVAGPSPPPRS